MSYTIRDIKKIRQGYYTLILENEGLDLSEEIPADLLVTQQLAKGRVLTQEDYQSLVLEGQRMAAYLAALRILGHSDQFIGQLRLKLKQRQLSPEAIEAAILRLCDEGLLDDQRTAIHWVQGHQEKKSPRAMAERLKAYDLDRPTIEKALATLTVTPESVMFEKAKRKWEALSGDGTLGGDRQSGEAASKKKEAQLLSYLMRQGYDYSSCRQALNTLKSEAY